MARRNLGIAPAIRPWARPVRSYEFITIIIAILGIGITLGTMLLNATGRIDSAIVEAAADRRALQASMDEFRRQMQRLGERQARLEGQRESTSQQ